MKNILVPTDFSNNAYNALLYATRLFQNEPCTFFILHVFEGNTSVLTNRIATQKGMQIYQKLENQSHEGLIETLHSIVRDTEDMKHSFEMLSISRGLIDTLNKTIKSKNIDFVIMGTKGATGAREIFMGSNTIKAIEAIKDCPVIAVPEIFDYEPPKEIAFPTAFDRNYPEKDLKPLTTISDLFHSKIRIIHVANEEKLDHQQEYNFSILKKHLVGFQLSKHNIPKFSNKEKHINDFVSTMKIPMVAMINYKHSLMERITHEPIIKKLGYHSNVPFLVIPSMN